MEIATLGGGCFWCLEAVYLDLEGVTGVSSGYSGGSVKDPTYEEVCRGTTGHAEVVRVEFDPTVISYQEILEVYFGIHDPTTLNRQGADVGTQYRSVIFFHSPEQRERAKEMIEELEAEGIWEDPVVTEVLPAGEFFPAEAYHHDYFRRNPQQVYCQAVIRPKVKEFRARFAHKLRSSRMAREGEEWEEASHPKPSHPSVPQEAGIMADVPDSEGHPLLTDEETGLPNKLHFSTVFDFLFAFGARGIPVTLILLEVEGFPGWRSERDPPEIRRVCRWLGELLSSCVRRSDLAARLGDTRFGLILVDCNLAGGRLVADRLDLRLDPVREATGLRFSLGVAAYQGEMARSGELMGGAESALRSARSLGGDRAGFHR